MERFVEQTLLYDFYGELLTDHQKTIYEAIVFEDMSYSELAEEKGISRQGIFDLMKRCDKILEEYENKLHLVEKFLETKREASRIKELAKSISLTSPSEELDEIITIAEKLSE